MPNISEDFIAYKGLTLDSKGTLKEAINFFKEKKVITKVEYKKYFSEFKKSLTDKDFKELFNRFKQTSNSKGFEFV